MYWVRSNNSSDTGQRHFVREKTNKKTTDKKNRAKNRVKEWRLDEASPNTIGSYSENTLFCSIVLNNVDTYKRADLNCVILAFLLHEFMDLQS